MPAGNVIIIGANPREANLKRKVREHLHHLGFTRTQEGALCPPGNGKEAIRALHSAQREERLRASESFISRKMAKLMPYFASGCEVVPQRVSPVLERVSSGTWQSDLFRLASLSWSVPVSNGFGRRLRYLVWDQANGKLMGLIAIGDPVFNLGVRDQFIGWDSADRAARLVNLMDAYVLGAIPPYNTLLGGKLVACLLRSRDQLVKLAQLRASLELAGYPCKVSVIPSAPLLVEYQGKTVAVGCYPGLIDSFERQQASAGTAGVHQIIGLNEYLLRSDLASAQLKVQAFLKPD